MNGGNAAYRIDGQPASAGAFYAAACDPRRSIVVEACAGAGKTWMLVSRILRALLDGAQPQEILALTFTRKAAGEMRQRLDEWLREFARPVAPDRAALGELAAELVKRGMDETQARDAAPLLASMHERLLESGRSVAIRSFHAWFAQLVAAAPLETLQALGLPAQPELIEDTDDLADELFARFHGAVQADAALREDYARLIGRHRLSRVTTWLNTAWQRRLEVERADAVGALAGSVPPAARIWPQCAGLPTPEAQVCTGPVASELAALASLLGAQPGKVAAEAAGALRAALDLADLPAAYAAARKALMTDKGEPRKRMGDLPQHAAACEVLDEIGLQVAQQQAHEDHERLVRLVRVLLREYALMKRERGLADMADLESAAHALLSDPALAGWLQQRLDTQLRHLLIDEFQDTSPLQWHALFGWLSAFAGAGGGSGARAPLSVFIVGDPKQSIYRFRRAEPRVFAAARQFVVEGLGGAVLECDHTQRCARPIVDALNRVFEPLDAGGEWPGFRTHTTASSAAGHLCSLPDVPRPPRSRSDPPAAVWRDSLVQPRHEPEDDLRAQEARHVARAIADRIARGRRPQEIMVLARRRVALRAVAEALAEVQVPHVMPEALGLANAPEARDLLAVLDVLSSNGHDLSLAQALKSPLFDATDEELLMLSQRAAGGSWWHALVEAPGEWAGALARARMLLGRWSAAAPWLPPHDLLDRILHEGELVPRLLVRVPAARMSLALQVVDALVAASLALDGGRYATPYGFVRALRTRRVEAPAVGVDSAVQLHTVHGAKGLEAPVVFLVDADPSRGAPDGGTMLVDWPVERDAPRRVAFIALDSRPPPSLVELHAEETRARAREELNGLYVAMTRAREELVLSRTEPYHPSSVASWWQRLQALATPWAPTADAVQRNMAVHERVWFDLPAWAGSGAAHTAAAPDGTAGERQSAALGAAVHRVLEWVGGRGPADRQAVFRAAQGAVTACMLPLARAPEVERLAWQILESAPCRRFFMPDTPAWSGNEVPVVVAGQPGRIDRLVAFDEPQGRVWWVLDYKLQSAPQELAGNRAQLAGYVQAVRTLQPGERVIGAFVAAGGELVVIDD